MLFKTNTFSCVHLKKKLIFLSQKTHVIKVLFAGGEQSFVLFTGEQYLSDKLNETMEIVFFCNKIYVEKSMRSIITIIISSLSCCNLNLRTIAPVRCNSSEPLGFLKEQKSELMKTTTRKYSKYVCMQVCMTY